MKLAVIGSRSLCITELGAYLPPGVTELVSGGACGTDSCVRRYAQENLIPLMEFLPEYERYGRAAPIKRNQQIIDYADRVLAFWDGVSRGTRFVIDECVRKNVPIAVYVPDGDAFACGYKSGK